MVRVEMEYDSPHPMVDKLALALEAMTQWRETGRLPWPLPGGCATGPELVRWCRRVLQEKEA